MEYTLVGISVIAILGIMNLIFIITICILQKEVDDLKKDNTKLQLSLTYTNIQLEKANTQLLALRPETYISTVEKKTDIIPIHGMKHYSKYDLDNMQNMLDKGMTWIKEDALWNMRSEICKHMIVEKVDNPNLHMDLNEGADYHIKLNVADIPLI